MKKNFYAVKVGRSTGIYRSWDECKQQVQGFSGADYEGFETYAEASDYLGISSSQSDSIPQTLFAYIGGFRSDYILGVGIVYHDIISGKTIDCSYSFNVSTCQKAAKWAPFFVGSIIAVKAAVKARYREIMICTNEPELEKWTHQNYGRYTSIAKLFQEKIKEYNGSIRIRFVTMPGYSQKCADKANENAGTAARKKNNYVDSAFDIIK